MIDLNRARRGFLKLRQHVKRVPRTGGNRLVIRFHPKHAPHDGADVRRQLFGQDKFDALKSAVFENRENIRLMLNRALGRVDGVQPDLNRAFRRCVGFNCLNRWGKWNAFHSFTLCDNPSLVPAQPLIQKAPTIARYGFDWPADYRPIEVEMNCIQMGGRWKQTNGNWAGMGLYHHYRELDKILWPKIKRHRWDDLLLRSCVDHNIVGVLGPANSGKSNFMARWALLNYFCYPNDSTILVSSTDLRGLELRIWGEIKKLWRSAKKIIPVLPGNILEARIMITTEGLADEEARDFRNGIIGIPCIVNSNFVGLGRYVGIKNTRVMLLGDELQFMQTSWLEALANLNTNPWFHCVGAGNPKDPTDALGKFCEPSHKDGGWEGVDQTEKTKTWRTKFLNGICVNLVGTDSPNFDVPEDQPQPFPFLIGRKKIMEVIEFFGKDSLQYWMQCVGMMRMNVIARRVITKMMCVKFHAMEQPNWEGPKTKILGLDAAYGNVGGDRCALTEMHFGMDTNGVQVICFIDRPIIVPVTVFMFKRSQEDQIVDYVSNHAKERGIPPENVFYDATGRGTLAMAFARLWSNAVVGVEFGGKASERPVSKEVKLPCHQHYSNFVTELWFSVRYAIESGQMRGLPDEVIEEGTMREWSIVQGNKVCIEPKQDTKLKLGRSPDLFDSLVVAVEGARQRGFQINALGTPAMKAQAQAWMLQMREKYARLKRSKMLTAA